MNDKTMQEYIDACNKATSNLEAPLIGKISTPICVSCQNRIPSSGMKLSTCKIYGDIPKEFMLCESLDCPAYEQIPNCPKDQLPDI